MINKSQLPRRTFLKSGVATSAALAATPYFSSQPKAFANQGAADRPNIGCIGVGSMGSGDARGRAGGQQQLPPRKHQQRVRRLGHALLDHELAHEAVRGKRTQRRSGRPASRRARAADPKGEAGVWERGGATRP